MFPFMTLIYEQNIQFFWLPLSLQKKEARRGLALVSMLAEVPERHPIDIE